MDGNYSLQKKTKRDDKGDIALTQNQGYFIRSETARPSHATDTEPTTAYTNQAKQTTARATRSNAAAGRANSKSLPATSKKLIKPSMAKRPRKNTAKAKTIAQSVAVKSTLKMNAKLRDRVNARARSHRAQKRSEGNRAREDEDAVCLSHLPDHSNLHRHGSLIPAVISRSHAPNVLASSPTWTSAASFL